MKPFTHIMNKTSYEKWLKSLNNPIPYETLKQWKPNIYYCVNIYNQTQFKAKRVLHSLTMSH